jgi:caa(3)-type oxidase subunit IV
MSYLHYDPINDPSIHGDHPGALPHLHYKVEKGVIPPAQTKWIWKVFWIMLIITIVELIVGFQKDAWHLGDLFLKVFFISLTLVKAYYIVYSFMHLKDENRALRATIMYPFLMLIIYLIFIVLTEGAYSYDHKHDMDATLLKSAQHAGGHGDGGHDADADHSAGEKQKH